ncbi:armadillo repeat-containing protein 6 homolog isoform X1 [Spodoptera frugiperda]|uniref:Armadillo repeat-containing protein 6 homolog isoform X1 n=1 Tax=Spodoptera frugiperda TaxID=7108 RepID=A0A9R0DIA2_SPOFR|nr:armadillo repeat-containing protein 6 homolog isoform X1 [Spodoptera frugiperda]
MVRVITQETYDEVVKENIDEFEMTPEEAIKEAVAQFEAQGVDLSNIIKDLALGSGDNHVVTENVEKLKELCSGNKYDHDAVLKELSVLKAECEKDIARRVRAGKEGAYKVLLDLLYSKYSKIFEEMSDRDAKFIITVLETMTALMEMQPDLLDSKGVDLIKNLLDNVENEDILVATLKWTTTCCVKHEMNRQKLFAKNIAENLKLLLKVTGNYKLLSETLQVIRKLTLDDDVRVEFGKAHDHAKELGAQMLEPLTNLLKENTKPPLVSELMLTIASLLVRHELCKMVADCGVDVLFTVLADNYDNVTVVQQADKLITALAGHDDVKRDLVKSGIVPVVVSILSRHSSNANATALTLKCVAALCLREPTHGRQFIDSGAPDVIIECMKVHPDNASVQKNACWAIRNMVARCRDQNVKFHELGVEAILNAAYDKFASDFGFDIKSALRDLECDVKLDEQWTGQGVQLEH